MPEHHGAHAAGESTPDSSATGRGPTPASGRQRLLGALRSPSRGQAVVAVLLAVVGFGAVTQVRTNGVDDTYAGRREQDLIDIFNGLTGTSQRAEAEISRLEQDRRALQSDTSAKEAALGQAQQEADTLSILAGLVPVTGPGVRITVKEGEGAVGVGAVLDLVQELRTAGAEAMQINGQVRIVAQTSFEASAGGLLVDGQELGPPYVVDAIGEPHTLAGGLDFRDGPVDQFEKAGATVDIDELDSLDIESVVKSAQPEFAVPQDTP